MESESASTVEVHIIDMIKIIKYNVTLFESQEIIYTGDRLRPLVFVYEKVQLKPFHQRLALVDSDCIFSLLPSVEHQMKWPHVYEMYQSGHGVQCCLHLHD